MLHFTEKIEPQKILRLLSRSLPYYLKSWNDDGEASGSRHGGDQSPATGWPGREMVLRDIKLSVGAEVTAIAQNVPPGWGEPVYDKLDADLAYAMMNINAVKGVVQPVDTQRLVAAHQPHIHQ